MTNELAAATEANRVLEQSLNKRWYPTFHIAARAGWINDPNGLCYFNGRSHVYFQHHPASTQWGPMHWGHVSSADLVHWRHEPIALAPSVEEDSGGVWSGSAVVVDDVQYVFYTGNQWEGDGDGDAKIQRQMLATSTDGIHFEKQGVVIEAPGYSDFRDPKVWRMGDRWHMIVAASSQEGRGQVWHYTSDDLRKWEFERVIFEDPDPDVFMVECPDLFELDGRWVLIYGPMTTRRPSGYACRNGHNAGYVVGRWEPGAEFVIEEPYRPLDWGHHYYAPQTMETPDGRRVAFGWMGGFTLPLASQASDGWSGQMALPRELRLSADGRLIASPIQELDQLRRDSRNWESVTLRADEDLMLASDAAAVEVELELDLEASSAEQIGLLVHATPDGRGTWVGYDDQSRRIVLDRRTAVDRGVRSAPYEGGGVLRLRVFVDRGSVEVFIGDGAESLSSLSFPSDGPRAVVLSCTMGDATVNRIRVHQLDSGWE